ncbi:hypothetical protein Q9Q94_07530 [Uliginosibacterium sp. 31-16]|uniref:hypothetical protein n=1 Tax=Uliginosibacterium sp. 31-16 TaxID=3068315 RepID=UPI00273D2B1E|nr:hypothetical protein [Uliginosibacterium sp. 31-16]MDP5239376.1 hypothetical protein [Uliginosibacterium sp. 31-16]
MKKSKAEAAREFRRFRYKTPQLHWVLLAFRAAINAFFLALLLVPLGVVLLMFLAPGRLPDPDAWPTGTILSVMISCLFGAVSGLVFGEARLMGTLRIGPRYVICNGQIAYYRNIREAVLACGKQLTLQTQAGACLKIRQDWFYVLGRRQDEKAAERFDAAASLIRENLRALVPAATWKEIEQPRRRKKSPPGAAPEKTALRANRPGTRKTQR